MMRRAMRVTPVATGALVGLLCAVLILGPALAPGFVLSYDMVFVPDLGFSDRTLGLDGSVPCAVPNDAVVAALSTFLPGWVIQKLILVAVFVIVGAGVGVLSTSRRMAVVAAVVACWNPWLAQRLEIGHWGFLLGYAVLPWALWAAVRVRKDRQNAVLVLASVKVGS